MDFFFGLEGVRAFIYMFDMRMLIFLLGCAVFCGLSALADGDLHLLPQSDKYPRAISYDYFPSRLHAYVFRNWTSVKLEHLANTIDATPPCRLIETDLQYKPLQTGWGLFPTTGADSSARLKG